MYTACALATARDPVCDPTLHRGSFPAPTPNFVLTEITRFSAEQSDAVSRPDAYRKLVTTTESTEANCCTRVTVGK